MPTLLAAAILLAHSWYPSNCCNGNAEGGDCRPIPCAELIPNGEHFIHNGHWIARNEVRESPDGQCHICEQENHDRIYCAWMPQGFTS